MDKHSLAFLIKVRLCRTKGWVTTKMCWKWPRWINYWCWVYVHGYSIVLTEGFKIFQSSVRFSGTCGLEWIRCNVASPVYHVTDKDHTKTKGVFIIRVEKKYWGQFLIFMITPWFFYHETWRCWRNWWRGGVAMVDECLFLIFQNFKEQE